MASRRLSSETMQFRAERISGTRVVLATFGEGAEAEMGPVCATTEMATKVTMNRRRMEAAMVIFIWSV